MKIFEVISNDALGPPTPSPEEVSKQHDVPLSSIMAQLKMGIKVETEHVEDEVIAREIALDHLAELPDYYTKLQKMESEPPAK